MSLRVYCTVDSPNNMEPEPDADDLYDFIGLPPTAEQAEVTKRLSRIRATKLSDEAWDDQRIYDAENILSNVDKRREYNEKHGYPTEWGPTLDLRISFDSDQVEVESPVSVSVTDSDGEPVSDVNLVVDGSVRGSTDESGSLVVEFDEAGTFEVKTETDDTPNPFIEDDQQTITVVKETRQLSLSIATSITAGDDATVQVTDETGEPVANATVKNSANSATTDAEGKCSLTFPDAGSVTVEASKSSSESVSYEQVVETVSVEYRTRRLQYTFEPSSPTAKRPVNVRVHDEDGVAVEGATISFPFGTETTDKSGSATVEFPAARTYNVHVSKPQSTSTQFVEQSGSIRVQKRERQLRVSMSPSSPEVGQQTTFRAIDSAGDPVPNANLSVGDTVGTTDESGEWKTEFTSTGTVAVEAWKSDTDATEYKSTTQTIEVSKRTCRLSITLSADSVEVGEPLTVIVTDDSGSSVSGVTVETGDTSQTTAADGETTLEFSSTGVTSIKAYKAATDTTNYEPATATVDVTPKVRSLSLNPSTTSIEYGDSIEFTVTVEGEPVEGATVRTPTKEETTRAGSATLTFEELGTTEVVAEKEDTPTVEFLDDSVEVNVERKEGTLEIHTERDVVAPNQSVTITVTDADGSAIEGALVDFPNSLKVTDSDGQCTVEFANPVRVHFEARKEEESVRYSPTEETITVRKDAAGTDTSQASSELEAADTGRTDYAKQLALTVGPGAVVGVATGGTILHVTGQLISAASAGIISTVAVAFIAFIVYTPPSRAT